MSDDPDPLEHFSGTARLFPLPNLVLFPLAVVPLHIFEPRYRQLMEDALADDRLMAMALLQPGWQNDYDQSPPIYPVFCLGSIAAEQRLADGRYNLLLHGLCRARVIEENKGDRLYRSARVELLKEVNPTAGEEDILRRQMGASLESWYSDQPQMLPQLRKLLDGGLGLGPLCDLFSFALPLELALKQALLEEVHVEVRAQRLLTILQAALPAKSAHEGKFPPDFSSN
jgi:Lon protease-like protein